ncbi:MAG: flagellar biosynthetic protein FliR [Lachnospiraceae bacterium]|nr:flagellar biosynthetic protein FliR [Lachnospiraceae bacterium]
MIDYSFSYSDLEFFLLILVRMASFVVSAPFFSMPNVPRQFKAGFAFCISVIMFSVLPDHTPPVYNSVIGFEIIVIKEIIAGLVIGLGGNIVISVVNLAGKVADMEIGLSMVQLFDPMTRDSSGFTGTLYQYGVMLIMFVSNMHHYFLRAFTESYTLIPVGGVHYNSELIVSVISKFLVDYVRIAFSICLPIMASIIILNAVLGILAKTSPQMNMFSVGIQIKVLVGLSILFVTIALLPYLSEFIFDEMKQMTDAMIQSLR